MKVLERFEIPNTRGKYELHRVGGVKDFPFRVWSNISEVYLKDTVRFGRKDIRPTSTFGMKFEVGDEARSILSLKKILELCEIDYNDYV